MANRSWYNNIISSTHHKLCVHFTETNEKKKRTETIKVKGTLQIRYQTSLYARLNFTTTLIKGLE
jgi:hypothetical protein